jgi:hypothetical protein
VKSLDAFFAWGLKWSPFTIIPALILAKIDASTNFLADIHIQLANAQSMVTPFLSDGFFAKVNTVIPASEYLAMIAFSLALKAGCAVIRMVKSFIPTIS